MPEGRGFRGEEIDEDHQPCGTGPWAAALALVSSSFHRTSDGSQKCDASSTWPRGPACAATLFAQETQKAQVAEPSVLVPARAADARQLDASIATSVHALVKQLTEHLAEPSTAAGRVGLLLIDANGGEASLIAEEPDPWLCRCGSPAWSSDGKRILFDVTTGNKDYSYSRIKGRVGRRPPCSDRPGAGGMSAVLSVRRPSRLRPEQRCDTR